MPFCFDPAMPDWEKYIERNEAGDEGDPDRSYFKYIEPFAARATIVKFAETPGPEPEDPRLSGHFIQPVRSPGLIARLFGAKAAPKPPEETTEQIMARYERREQACARYAQWKVSNWTTKCRELGAGRVYGSYDGGNDEGFTHFHKVEMDDGRMLNWDEVPQKLRDIYEKIIEDSVGVLMGNFGAGEYSLRGAVVTDFGLCSITDEKDLDSVFDPEPSAGS